MADVPAEEGAAEVVEGEEAVAEEEEKLNRRLVLHVLPFVTGVQRQHGLRHDDYERYRRFCSRRLRRIRHALKFQCGKKQFKQQTITREIINDERYLHILVYEAERAWSYFNQLKAEMEKDDHKKFHMIGRLRKAAQYANELRDLIGEDGVLCDERTELEASAYAAWINALCQRERQTWKSALELFGQAKLIYERLGGVCGEVNKPLYAKKLEDIDAQIRYCSFMLGGSATELDALMASTSSAVDLEMLKQKMERVTENNDADADSNNLSSISWRGQVKPVTSPKLQVNIMKFRNKEKELAQVANFEAAMAAYDELFGAYGDAVSTISDETAAEQKVPNPNETTLANLSFSMDYMSHLKLDKTVHRALRMVADTLDNIKNKVGKAKPDDVVRLYDMVLSALGSMESIETVEDDVEFGKLLSARTLLYKAMRCVYLAQAHLDASRNKEASALLERASTHSRLAQSELSECAEPLEDGEAVMMTQFHEIVRRQRILLQAKAFMLDMQTQKGDADDKDEDSAEGKSLIQKLASYDFGAEIANGDANLVNFPPDFEPTPCKPLFFDLAGNYIAFPDLTERAAAPASGAVDTAKAMFTSGLKSFGLWG